MNRLVAYLLLVPSVLCFSQAPQIKPGATVYIEPMNGYETYLAAAILAKRVPVIIVTDKSKADYVITGIAREHVLNRPAVVVHNTTNINGGGNDAWSQGVNLGANAAAARAGDTITTTSVSVVDSHSSQVVFAGSVGTFKNDGLQITAKVWAKGFKKYIEKPRK